MTVIDGEDRGGGGGARDGCWKNSEWSFILVGCITTGSYFLSWFHESIGLELDTVWHRTIDVSFFIIRGEYSQFWSSLAKPRVFHKVYPAYCSPGEIIGTRGHVPRGFKSCIRPRGCKLRGHGSYQEKKISTLAINPQLLLLMEFYPSSRSRTLHLESFVLSRIAFFSILL